MSEPEVHISYHSTIWDETPEGQYRMDRLRMAYEKTELEVASLLKEDAHMRIQEAIVNHFLGL